jgi:hypothetical protein
MTKLEIAIEALRFLRDDYPSSTHVWQICNDALAKMEKMPDDIAMDPFERDELSIRLCPHGKGGGLNCAECKPQGK